MHDYNNIEHSMDDLCGDSEWNLMLEETSSSRDSKQMKWFNSMKNSYLLLFFLLSFLLLFAYFIEKIIIENN